MANIMYVCDYRACVEKYCPVVGKNVQMNVREFGLNHATQIKTLCEHHDTCKNQCGGCRNMYKNCCIR